MVRRITFDESTKHHFEYIQNGFLIGVASDKARDVTKRKQETRISKALKSISKVDVDTTTGKPKKNDATREEVRTLISVPCYIDLEHDDLKRLVELIQSVDWFGYTVDLAMDAADYVDASDTTGEVAKTKEDSK